jgi:hypothetical protein
MTRPFLTGPDASPAKDTSVLVKEKVFPAGINPQFRPTETVTDVIHSVSIRKGLELTVSAHFAEHAQMVPFRKKKFEV